MAIGTTNINLVTVANILGSNTYELSQVCSHANINKWSKYKPMIGKWPEGNDGSYGLNKTTWVYTPPDVSTDLAQFAGYEPCTNIAFPPVLMYQWGTYARDIQPAVGATEYNWNAFYPRCFKTTDSGRLSTAELELSDLYLGVKLEFNGNTYYKTGTTKISDIDDDMWTELLVDACIVDVTTTPSFFDCPYYIGSYTYTIYMCTETQSSWTTSVPGIVTNIPTITRDVSTSINTGTFNIKDWIYSGTDSSEHIYMSWLADTTPKTDFSTNIWSSYGTTAPAWKIKVPDWITAEVYDSEEIIKSDPDTWQSGYKLVLYAAENTDIYRDDTVDISIGTSNTYSITIHQDGPIVEPAVFINVPEPEIFTCDTVVENTYITIYDDKCYFMFENVVDWSGTPADMKYSIKDAGENVVGTGTITGVTDGAYQWSPASGYHTISRTAESGDEFYVYLGNSVW